MRAMTFREYLRRSRAPRYSLVFALPLLVLYEGFSAALTGSGTDGVRNGADVLLKTLFLSLGGREGLYVFGAALLGGGAWLVWRDRRAAREPWEARVLAWMLLESATYAAVFGVARTMRNAQSTDVRQTGGFGEIVFTGAAKTLLLQWNSPDNTSTVGCQDARLELWRVA